MKHGATVVAFVAVATLTQGPARGEVFRLTAEEAVRRAITANLGLRASRKDVDVAEANVERSKVWLPSNPFLSGGVQRTAANQFGPNYGFYLQQEFEVAGQRSRRMAIAEGDRKKADWEVRNAEQTLAASVKSAIVKAQVSADRLALVRQNAEALRELVRAVDKRSRLSDVERIDRNTTHIQDVRSRLDEAEAEQSFDDAVESVRHLLNLSPNDELQLVGGVEAQVRELPPTPQLVERALDLRPDLIAQRHGVDRADEQISLSRREAIPNLTLSGSVSTFEGDTFGGGDLGFSLPLFDRKTAEVHEAVAERDRATLQFQDASRGVAQEVAQARKACEVQALHLQLVRSEILPRSEENLQIEQDLYERGEVTVSDLIGVRIDTIAARRELLDVTEAYNEALIELDRVTGTVWSVD